MTRTDEGRSLPQPVRAFADVVANEREGPTGRRMRLRVPGWPGSQPGQFIMLSVLGGGSAGLTDPLLPRPMAVYRDARTPDGGEVELLYRVVGRGTRLLAATSAGWSVRVVGPLGYPFPAMRPGQGAILVGGGTGVGSLYGLACRVVETGGATAILGAQTASELLGHDDFAALDLSLRVTTEDGSRGERGLVTDALLDELDRPNRRGDVVVFACGPTPMMRGCAEIAAQRGLPCFVSLENNMACGFGVCLGCATPGVGGGCHLVCRDGPVFEAREVAWEKLL